MTGEVKIRITADTSALERSVKEARARLSGVAKTSKEADAAAGRIADTVAQAQQSTGSFLAGLFPSIGGIGKEIGGIGDAWKKAGTMGKVAFAGVAVAAAAVIAKIVVDIGKAIFNVSKDLAKAADPERYGRQMAKLNSSIDRMKSALGNLFGSALLDFFVDKISTVADAVTTASEWVMQAVAYVQGLVGYTDKIADDADRISEDVSEIGEGLAGFDKLNTLGDLGSIAGLRESERIAELTAQARKDGAELGKTLGDVFMIDLPRKAGALVDGLWSGMVGVWTGFTDAVGGALSSIPQTITGMWSDVAEVSRRVGSQVSGFFDELGAEYFWMFDGVLDSVQSVAKTIKDTLTKVFGSLGGVVNGILTWNFEDVCKSAGEAFDALARGFEATIGAVIKPCLDMLNGIADVFGTIGDTVGGVWDGLAGAVGDFAGGVGDFFGGLFSGLPGFASGGVIAPGDPHAVIVGDNAHETEVISPLSTIREAVQDAMGTAGGGKTEIVIKLDGRVLARQLYDPLKAETVRRGAVMY